MLRSTICSMVYCNTTCFMIRQQIGSNLLRKLGDVNHLNNYQTIVVGNLMIKLFECLMEAKISA